MKGRKEVKAFKAVEFMREQRDRLSGLYQNDRDGFLAELDKAKQDFLVRRRKKDQQIKSTE